MRNAWKILSDDRRQNSNQWKRREELLGDFWSSLEGETGLHEEFPTPILLCMAVILSITSSGRQRLRISSEKIPPTLPTPSTPSTDDTEAQANKMARREYLSRIKGSKLVAVISTRIRDFKYIFYTVYTLIGF